MFHPVLPPEPPPILDANDTKFGSITEVEAQKTDASKETLPVSGVDGSVDAVSTNKTKRLPSPHNLTKDEAVAASISKPETLPAEFSPVTSQVNAAGLGNTLEVGYPLKLEGRSPFAVVTKSKNLSSPRANAIAQTQSPQQPLTIEFDSQNPTPPQQPDAIEFKRRTPANEQPVLTVPVPQGNTTPPGTPRVVEVVADRQEYDDKRRIVTAEGNVIVRYDGSVVDADRLQVSLDNLIAVGEGNVAVTRGDQVLRGQRFTYNLVQDTGEVQNGRGEVNIPSADSDLSFAPTTTVVGGGVTARPPSDRVRQNQPLTGVGSSGGIDLNLGGTVDARNIRPPKQGGEVKRIRFEAESIDFYPSGWQARNVRLTNDPFSPPELEIRANKVTLTRISPLEDRIRTQGQRLVLDQRTSIPIPRNQQTIDRRERDATPAIASIGFDGDRKGGVFVERKFEVVNTESTRFSLTPQFFAQKTIQEGPDNIPSLFGLKARLNTILTPRSRVEGTGNLDSFDLNTIEDNLRASVRFQHQLGNTNPHLLNLEYSYRDRLYNGTLGYQTVQSSFGGVITSPNIPLGRSGFNLRYQGGAQLITANTDRQDLLDIPRRNDRISLSRLQASATVDGGLLLWQGKALPPTATGGLRYTPNPVVPYLRAIAGVTGTTSQYSSGDNQSTLIGTIGLEGQFGNFSRSYLDYTAFNISYSQGFNSGLSPFLFDRAVDNKVLSFGIAQQIYGPFRFGFQTSINLDTNERSSTDYILEYSRRTYGVTLRYNPVLELGGISFRISDFNWSGGTDPFSDRGEVKPVVGGVRQDN
jgi:lipopolysaccharide export system protein LptA